MTDFDPERALINDRERIIVERDQQQALRECAERAYEFERTRVAKLEAELDDFRRAWAILDEPRENLRHAHTATEAATQFRAKLDAANERVAALEKERDDLLDALATTPPERKP